MKTKLIHNIQSIIADYRNDDNINIDTLHIQQWIDQFDAKNQIFILKELEHVLKQRYVSKQKACGILLKYLDYLKSEYNYPTVEKLLDESHFLSLQGKEKSQTTLLSILKEVLIKKYSYNIESNKPISIKNYIYIDDIFATGGSFYKDLSMWWNNNAPITTEIKNKKKRLCIFYFFIHEKNYDKTMWRFHYNVNTYFKKYIRVTFWTKIQNSDESKKNISLIWPTQNKQPLNVEVYRRQIVRDVDAISARNNYNIYPEEFFRTETNPNIEKLFSTKENRIKFENIMLQKGLEIVKSTLNDSTFRPLGFVSLSKNFGFGTLIFTWRNIPNNTPLALWHKGGNFHPLFPRKHTN